jgi:hypothetical protein
MQMILQFDTKMGNPRLLKLLTNFLPTDQVPPTHARTSRTHSAAARVGSSVLPASGRSSRVASRRPCGMSVAAAARCRAEPAGPGRRLHPARPGCDRRVWWAGHRARVQEAAALQSYTGPKEELGAADRFLRELLCIPRLKPRLQCFNFYLEFNARLHDLSEGVEVRAPTRARARTTHCSPTRAPAPAPPPSGSVNCRRYISGSRCATHRSNLPENQSHSSRTSVIHRRQSPAAVCSGGRVLWRLCALAAL